jgi:tRNA (guanosine-2'-O-)-methyltransferase
MRPLDATGLKRLHREWRRRTEGRVALLLDSVQTPVNVGSIVRSAAAYRVEHLWLVGATATPGHPGARKTALGSDRYLTWTESTSAADAVAEVREAGYRIVGVELTDGARPIFEVDLREPVCLALGHEDRGLTPAVLAACDDVAFIPQLGRVGSLNVAIAASIALYEVRRQEWVP